MQSKFIRCALIAALFSLASVHLALAQSQPMPPPSTPPPLPSPAPPRDLLAGSIETPDEAIPVVIQYGEGQERRAQINRGLMFPVGLPPDHSVTVTLQLPLTRAGQPVSLRLYDGGEIGAAALPGSDIITLGHFIVPPTGTVRFNFKAGRILGLYRLQVMIGPTQSLLQFYAGRPRERSLPLPTPPPGPPVTPTPN